MNRHGLYFRRFLLGALAFLLIAGIIGCSYLSIPPKDDIQAKPSPQQGKNGNPVYNSAVIKGKIVSSGKVRAATLIIAHHPADNSKELTEYASVNSTGDFMLYLPEGRYHLYAVTDYNANGIYENDDVSGCYGSTEAPREISVREGELMTDVVIQISQSNGYTMKLPVDLSLIENREIIRQVTHNGQILKIYSEYFSPENAQTGYWNPSSFMKSFGAHIYLTEDFNPRKIPILFVHGTEGSPHNWIYLYMRLDRSRYQPWFFYYPSGIRLSLAADLLNEELRELRKKYGFQKMAIVAHSVGGLTARSFLTRFVSDKQNHFVKLFVTFATPWSGFSAADASQIITHKSIPVWMDLGSQSDFIRNTLQGQMPPTVRHYIFYGINDKLSGSKALDDRAVSCAVKCLEFDCTHDSILSSRKVFSQFNAILEKELW
jgi:hypothetical protein